MRINYDRDITFVDVVSKGIKKQHVYYKDKRLPRISLDPYDYGHKEEKLENELRDIIMYETYMHVMHKQLKERHLPDYLLYEEIIMSSDKGYFKRLPCLTKYDWDMRKKRILLREINNIE